MNHIHFNQTQFYLKTPKPNNKSPHSNYMSNKIKHLLQDQIHSVSFSNKKSSSSGVRMNKQMHQNQSEIQSQINQQFNKHLRAKSHHLTYRKKNSQTIENSKTIDHSKTIDNSKTINPKTQKSLSLHIINCFQANNPIHSHLYQKFSQIILSNQPTSSKPQSKSQSRFFNRTKLETTINPQLMKTSQNWKTPSKQRDLKSIQKQKQEINARISQNISGLRIFNSKQIVQISQYKDQVFGWTPKMKIIFAKMSERKNTKISKQFLNNTMDANNLQKSNRQTQFSDGINLKGKKQQLLEQSNKMRKLSNNQFKCYKKRSDIRIRVDLKHQLSSLEKNEKYGSFSYRPWSPIKKEAIQVEDFQLTVKQQQGTMR